MYSRTNRHLVVISMLALGLLGFGARNAFAVPSYSRQTGLPCETCHTVAPQLTAFGRYFKMNGYVLSSSTLSPSSPGKTPTESISKFPPISAMVLVSDTVLNKAQPDSQNGTVAFPDQLSLFYAGRIAPHLGSFIQITYTEGDDHFSLDNTDIRYANTAMLGKSPVVWGLTLNNNPTVDDPWNSTPAWGFPYLGSDSAPGPSAGPQILDLGGAVAGLGAYAWFNNSIYAGVSLYRSSQIGQSQPLDSTASNVIKNVAPYWRVAWEHNWSTKGNYTNSFEVGTFGMYQQLYPGGGAPLSGPTDDYTDYAVDTQYQLLTPNRSSLTVHGMFIHEKQTLDASDPAQPDNHLNTLAVSAQYYWWEKFGPSLGYFDTTGNSNANLYGGPNASPDSNGWILQWTYLPAENVQLGAQYTLYNKFDGASSNYDGTGRSASDNNALYLFAWFLF
jgi:hypothetical protein